jgi:hypothetical protein
MKNSFKHLFITSLLLFFVIGQSWAHDNVVVVPMMSSTGNAQAGDVVTGKTFSNSGKRGITGNRPPVPIAKTGIGRSDYAGDDGSTAHTHGVSVTPPRFLEIVGDWYGVGTYDNLTGLFWQSTPSSSNYTWIQAIDHCENLETGVLTPKTTDWRLPNINELLSILNWTKLNPPLDDVFSIGFNGPFWTSTPYILSTAVAWTVVMNGPGDIAIESKTLPNRAMCVRGQ